MTNKEQLAYAEQRPDEAIRNDSGDDIKYWRGYRDAMQMVLEMEEEK